MEDVKKISIKIPFGLRDDRLWFIQDVANGRACGCICPHCKTPLEARNNPKNIRQAHFAHSKPVDCTYTEMTAIHAMAQQILKNEGRIKTPNYEQATSVTLVDGSELYGEPIFLTAKELKADQVATEYYWNGFIADVFFEIKGKPLLIEIAVTHFSEDKKIKAVKDSDVAVIEIDLSDLSPEEFNNKDLFTNAVLDATKYGYWLNNPKGNALYKDVINQLHKDAEIKNADLYVELAKKEEKDIREKKRLDDLENRKQTARNEIASDFDQLLNAQNLDWQRERHIYLQSQFTALTQSEIWQSTNKHIPIVNVDITGDWIFQARRAIWQSYIIENILLPLHTTQSPITVNEIKKAIVRKFGILPFIKNLNIKKQEQKRIGSERGKNYGQYGCWFLTEKENKLIISPWTPISKYINHLNKSALIRIENNLIYCMYESLDAFMEDRRIKQIEKTKSEIKSRQEMAERSRQYENVHLQNEQEKEKIRQLKIERIPILMAADKRIYHENNGTGLKCCNCEIGYLASDVLCPFCGHTQSEPYQILSNDLASAYHKYKCINRPSVSVVKAEKININSIFQYLEDHEDQAR